MREQIRAFVDSAAGAFRLSGPFYRFGACPGGGSGVEAWLRECFPQAACVEFELEDGVELDRLPFPDGAARTLLCGGALECAFQPQRAVAEMMRILAPGGVLLVWATAGGRGPDPAPAYWHLTPRSIQRLLAPVETTLVGWQGAETFPHTLYGVGFKRPLRGSILEETKRFLDGFQARLDEAARRIGWEERLKHFLMGWAGSRAERRHRRDYYKLGFAVHLAVKPNLKHELLNGCLPEAKTGSRLDLGD